MKKYKLILMILILFILVLVGSLFFRNKENDNRISINGIENFKPKMSSTGENYLLFYPRDSRNSQDSTIVKEVTKTGKIVREYSIKDVDFGRMNIHQKPNEINKLYISLFGEPRIDNFFYSYDLDSKKFNKVNLDYFKYEVGVDHIRHYGDEVLFQTLVSHEIGEQNTNPETNEFNLSISNFSNKMSIETEYGKVPKWTPILGFNKKVIYGVSGQVNSDGEYGNAGIGVADLDKQNIKYISPEKNSDMYPVYSNQEHAYVINETGKLFVYNKKLEYEVFEPFNNLPKQDNYYNMDAPPLVVDKNRALYSLFSNQNGYTIGLLTFEPKPIFEPLKKDYIKADSNYRFIYQDTNKKEIYLLKISENGTKVIVIDNKEFNRKAEFPVEYGHLLDFVIKN